MSLKSRRAEIQRFIEASGQVTYEKLAHQFAVSEMTIRRDLEVLEDRGVVRRVLGGAISANANSSEPSFESRLSYAASQKMHIAESVVNLIQPGESVILDGGSTVLAVAREIRARNLGLTVITVSVPAALELVDDPATTVLLIGGHLRAGELSVIGSEAIEGLSRYNCDTYIAGVAGIHASKGLSDYNSDESSVKSAAIHAVRRVIVPVDSSKLGNVSLVNVASFGAVTTIVSDGPSNHPVLMAARKAGVEVIAC